MIESAKRCPQCGAENEGHRLFCSRCAAELVGGAAAEVEPPRARGRTSRSFSRLAGGLHHDWEDFLYRMTGRAPGASHRVRTARRALLLMASLLPGLGHLLVGRRREGRRFLAAFAVAAAVWLGLIGTLIGGIAALCAVSLMGSAIVDVARMDPEGGDRRRPVHVRDVLVAAAMVAGVYAVAIWGASAVWERVTVNRAIVRMRPDALSGNVAFEQGDRLLVSRGAYRRQDPSRGDVILARVDGVLAIQRVIAVPGDVVQTGGGVIYLNESELAAERYPLHPQAARDDGVQIPLGLYSVRVTPGRFLVWGMQGERDGVWLGPRHIKRGDVKGKAWLVYSPYRNRRVIDHLDPVLKQGGDDGTAGD